MADPARGHLCAKNSSPSEPYYRAPGWLNGGRAGRAAAARGGGGEVARAQAERPVPVRAARAAPLAKVVVVAATGVVLAGSWEARHQPAEPTTMTTVNE